MQKSTALCGGMHDNQYVTNTFYHAGKIKENVLTNLPILTETEQMFEILRKF